MNESWSDLNRDVMGSSSGLKFRVPSLNEMLFQIALPYSKMQITRSPYINAFNIR
jgi:hypothetical protein